MGNWVKDFVFAIFNPGGKLIQNETISLLRSL